jgi:DNA-binding ferritin-like protein (Dps family)
MSQTSLIQVLGAVAYGEHKAHEKARGYAAEATEDDQRRTWQVIAAEELRHHKGFVRRLNAIGADPERAMRPYRASLDRFHGFAPDSDEVVEAVCSLLGEGIAADLLTWLRTVADPDTAAFIDTVIEDEAGHESRAAEELRRLLDARPDGRLQAARGAARMLGRMVASGAASGPSFAAFVRLGRSPALLSGLAAGFVRRLHLVGVGPLSALERLDPFGIVVRLDPFTASARSRPAA